MTTYIKQLILPKELREEVVKDLHCSPTSGHFGVNKTLARVKQRFYWPKCRDDVAQVCKHCDQCESRKPLAGKTKAPLGKYVVGAPMERIAIDILGPLPLSESGNKYLLVAMDYFTKWPEVYPLPNQTAVTVAEVLVRNFFCRFGTPMEIHSDQGRNFESNVFAEVCKIMGIKKTRTTPFHPQSDGMVERYNRTLENQLALFVNDNQNDWDERLPLVLMAYRSAVHESTGCSPARLMMGRELRLPLDLTYGRPDDHLRQCTTEYGQTLQENIETAHEFARKKLELTASRMKTNYDIDASANRFEPGTAVWLHSPAVKKGFSPKLARPWTGPYLVTKRINDLVYRIKLHRRSKPRVVHRNRLRRYQGLNAPSFTISQSTASELVMPRVEKQHIEPNRKSTRKRQKPDRLIL